MELDDFSSLLGKKCAVRNVHYNCFEDFFPEDILTQVEETWETHLGRLLRDLPLYDLVIKELRPQVRTLLDM